MKATILFYLFAHFIFACNDKEMVCNRELDRMMVAIIDDITIRHPMGFFIAPPQKECLVYRGTIDVSETLYGISTALKYEAFSPQDVEQMKVKVKSKGEIIYDCRNDNVDADLEFVSKALNMNFTSTIHHPLKNQLHFEIGKPEGLFYFTPPIRIQSNGNEIYSVAVAYHCGKLCFNHRLYFLYKYENEYKVLVFKIFDQ